MLKQIHESISRILAEHALDWRTCYTNAYVEKPDGSLLIVESSDERVLADLSAWIKSLNGELQRKIRFQALPAETAPLPERYLATGSVVDVRKEAAHSSELLTQATYGDLFEPLKSDGDWVLVRLQDGYVGWIRSWNLSPVTVARARTFGAAAEHRVKHNIIQAFEEPSIESLPVTDAVAGTHLIARPCQKRGWRSVEFPDGRTGFAASGSLQRIPKRNRVVREQLSSTGLRFMGIPYLWGGASPKGFDCSGLIQKIFSLNGQLLPRDSDMQARCGKLKPVPNVDSFLTGDLLFFGTDREKITHVGMYLSNALFLHAYGYVRIGSLDPKNPLFDAKLSKDWQFTRDPLAV
jgi:cell wall-associated NlpC family hydrolase